MNNRTKRRVTRRHIRWQLLLALFGLAVAGANFAQSSKGSAAQAGAAAQGASDVAKGRVVYKRNCEICHHSASEAKKIGPGLKGIYKRKTFAAGKPVNDPNMRVWIEDGGKDMPQFKNTLKPEQISDLIAYIRTL